MTFLTGYFSCVVFRSISGFVLLVLLLASSRSVAEELIPAAGAPANALRIPPGRLAVPPRIDGIWTPAEWSGAIRVDDFHCHDWNRAPTESTVVWMASDDRGLYFFARCFDRNPDKLRMEERKRLQLAYKGNAVPSLSDDFISFEIDAENLRRSNGAYAFTVTPRGTQADFIPDGAATKIEWRGDWTAAARVDSAGWTVEVSVPYSMLGLPSGKNTVGVSIRRWVPRLQEESRWPNMGFAWDRTRIAHWENLDVGSTGRAFPLVMPYGVAQARDGRFDGYVGLDVKKTFPSGQTFIGCVYPDFRNVENDVLGLDFSYSEKQRADSRPFFVEGYRFLPDAWMMYGQRIGEVYGGGKYFGQIRNHRIGVLTVYDREEVLHSAARWYWQPVPRLEFENNVVWRHAPPNTPVRSGVPMVEDNLLFVSLVKKSRMIGSLTEYMRLQTGFAQSDGDSADGFNLEGDYQIIPTASGPSLVVKARHLGNGMTPVDGLLDPMDFDQRDASIELGYERTADRQWFREWNVSGFVHRSVRSNGNLYLQRYTVESWTKARGGTELSTEFRVEERPPYRDWTFLHEFGWKQDQTYQKGGISARWGWLQGADYLLVTLDQGIHSWDRVTASARLQFRRRDFPAGHALRPTGGVEDRYQVVTTVQYDLTAERSISGRLTYNDDGSGNAWKSRFNGYCSYRQLVRNGFDLFLIVGDPSAETWTRRVAIKAMVVL
ncbi:MAG TPA: hypothetical protein P5569_07035 [Candidatus Latescibacteria bacterium]|nr:hypothetical protein [Candidatus Latescibacterota bacterium]